MDREVMRSLLLRQPFEPLAVTLCDGTTRCIPRPFCVALGDTSMVFIDPNTDRTEFISLDSISSVEPGKS